MCQVLCLATGGGLACSRERLAWDSGGCFLVTWLLWIVGFPAYLVNRGKLKQAAQNGGAFAPQGMAGYGPG